MYANSLWWAAQARVFTLAWWEGPGVLLFATCPARGRSGHSAIDVGPGPCRLCPVGRLTRRVVGAIVLTRAGYVAFWWALVVFAMTDRPALMLSVQRCGS